MLPALGVRLEDRPGKPSLWKLESPEALRAEQAEKAAAAAEAARKKLANKARRAGCQGRC